MSVDPDADRALGEEGVQHWHRRVAELGWDLTASEVLRAEITIGTAAVALFTALEGV